MSVIDPVDRGLARERALARIGRVATSSLDLDAILRGALAVLREVITFKGGSIALLDGENHLQIIAASGVLDQEARDVRIPVGTGIAGWVAEHGEPFLSPDLDAETRLPVPTRATGSNRLIRSYLAAPLITKDEVIGVLQIDSEFPDAFTSADVELVMAAASQLAGAVHTVRLFAEVRAERERLHAVIYGLPESIAVLDAAGRVIEANTAAEAVWGMPLPAGTAWLGNPALVLWWPDGRRVTEDERPVARALRGEIITDLELIHERADGTRVTLLTSAAPLRDADGTITAVVMVHIDISARKDIDRLKDEFLATASHDLRNPLTTVKGLVQVLRRRLDRDSALDPAVLANSLASIERQVNRLGEMLDTLLDVSRIQMGRLAVHPEPLDLGALVAEVVEQQAQVAASTHTIRLTHTGGPAIVLAERARLLQVLENLLSNAIKYSPEGGEVMVSVTADAAQESGRWPRPVFQSPDAPRPSLQLDSVRVSVRDSGIGVPAADLPYLFDRFYRTEAVRDRGLEGTGLGLYICKGIIESFGGRIGADSAGEGKGTRIWFTLPRAPENE